MKGQSLQVPAGASRSKSNARFFLILFAVIVGAGLSVYAIIQGVQYVGHKADERDAAEANRVARIAGFADNPSSLPEAWVEMEELQSELSIDDSMMEGLTLTWLRERTNDYMDCVASLELANRRAQECASILCTKLANEEIDSQNKAKATIEENYYLGAKTIDDETLWDNGLMTTLSP